MKTIAEQLNIKDFPFKIKDKLGNVIYFENSNGYWLQYQFDSKGNEIYFENSDGIIRDNRPGPVPEYTMAELQSMLGKEFKIKK
jgi:hypothetical protein